MKTHADNATALRKSRDETDSGPDRRANGTSSGTGSTESSTSGVPLRRGMLARDTRSGQLGEVMDFSPNAVLVALRPLGGGIEWWADRDRVHPA